MRQKHKSGLSIFVKAFLQKLPKKSIMKYGLHIFSVMLLLVFACGYKEAQKNSQPGFALVELFTSEGCSSCPPADEAIASLAMQNKSNVFILGFHVDYWDYLGWKDIYSNATYSERQRRYAQTFSLNSIYTPQIVVNGSTQFVGSDKQQLASTVDIALNGSYHSSIQLSAKETSDNNIMVNINMEKIVGHTVVHIALIQSTAVSHVQKGENKGKELRHINIVRDFKTIDQITNQNTVYLKMPSSLSKNELMLIAHTQDKNSMQIKDAAKSMIQ